MKHAGFSLIELLVALSLLIAITSIGIPSFTNSIGNSQIRTVAESVKNGFQVARLEAIKRNSKIKFTLTSDGAWSFGCNTASADCPATIQSKNSKEGSASDIALTITSGNTVIFNSFGLRDATSTISQVDVKKNNLTAAEQTELRVLINNGGNAKVCDPAVNTAGDPRTC